MEKNDLLTVAEVARIVGVSRQAIYKRMETDLSTYVIKVDKKKWLNKAVLQYFIVNDSTKKVDMSTEVDILRKMVEMLEKENELKQQTIDQLRREKQEEHEQLVQLTGQVGATLQALTQRQLAEKIIEGQQLAVTADPAEPDQQPETKKKKRWWQR